MTDGDIMRQQGWTGPLPGEDATVDDRPEYMKTEVVLKTYDTGKLGMSPEQVAEVNSVRRVPVDYDYSSLNWDFLHMMAQIAAYAKEKYGSAEQYTDGRLEDDKSPLTHICGHLREYARRQPYDHFNEDTAYHLAAIAYNAMIEYYYLHHGGPTAPGVFYE